jgi:hypothetical protein
MRPKLVLAIITVAGVVAIGLNMSKTRVDANAVSTPVVVELFTSEGCSSCPPADRLLGELQQQHTLKNAELILLGEHVDYWNELGWKDRFSSAEFTERQRQYASSLRLESAYTPQAVVDGRFDVVGNDQSGLERAIVRAASSPKPAQVSLSWSEEKLLHVAAANAFDSHVLLAVTEDDLSTQVGAGENGGRTLRHAAVVRELRDLGATKNGEFQTEVKLDWRPEWKKSNSHVVVLVQTANRQLVGAASVNP